MKDTVRKVTLKQQNLLKENQEYKNNEANLKAQLEKSDSSAIKPLLASLNVKTSEEAISQIEEIKTELRNKNEENQTLHIEISGMREGCQQINEIAQASSLSESIEIIKEIIESNKEICEMLKVQSPNEAKYKINEYRTKIDYPKDTDNLKLCEPFQSCIIDPLDESNHYT